MNDPLWMKRHWILNDAGEPEPVDDVLDWARWFEQSQRDGTRVIAHDRDESPGAPDVLVSTVFLGLDHNYHLSGPPILWETMILGGPLDGYQERYASRELALVGHAKACALMQRARKKILTRRKGQ